MCSHSDNTTRPWTGQSHTTSFTRPRTGQSRPGTSQAPTAGATSHYEAQPSFIIALLEGRGIAREVGMAALDRDTGRMMLIQVFVLSPYTVQSMVLIGGDSLLTARPT
jgi:DNA mismatch repair protein MSH4